MRLWKDLDEMIFSKPSFSLCVPPWLGRKSAPKLIAGGVLTCVLVYRVKTTSDKTKHHEKQQKFFLKKQQKKQHEKHIKQTERRQVRVAVQKRKNKKWTNKSITEKLQRQARHNDNPPTPPRSMNEDIHWQIPGTKEYACRNQLRSTCCIIQSFLVLTHNQTSAPPCFSPGERDEARTSCNMIPRWT